MAETDGGVPAGVEHDLGWPMSRIYGKERELQAVLRASGEQPAQAVRELM